MTFQEQVRAAQQKLFSSKESESSWLSPEDQAVLEVEAARLGMSVLKAAAQTGRGFGALGSGLYNAILLGMLIERESQGARILDDLLAHKAPVLESAPAQEAGQ